MVQLETLPGGRVAVIAVAADGTRTHVRNFASLAAAQKHIDRFGAASLVPIN